MTGEHSTDERSDGSTRRTVLKAGGATLAAAGIGTSGLGSVAAQDDLGGKALMYVNKFYPGALFRVVSSGEGDVPEVVEESGVFSDYNQYTIEYLNTDDQATLYVAESAEIDQGVVYSLETELDVTPPEGDLVTVRFEPATEEEFGITDDDDDEFLDEDDDVFGDVELADDGGKALVYADQFRPGALIQIVSGSVGEVPDYEAVRGSGVFSEFDTRYGRYLNTGETILVFVAHSAEVSEGEVYEVEDEFDITEPEANLVTVSLVGIDEETLADGVFDVGDGGDGGGGNQTGNATGNATGN